MKEGRGKKTICFPFPFVVTENEGKEKEETVLLGFRFLSPLHFR